MWPEVINFNNDYAFNCSPESISDSSMSTEIMDISSGEDFITQLSSDLDIPLLLNPGEDERALLNSFFDKSPDEILSDVSPPREDFSNDSVDVKDLDLSEWTFENCKIEELSDDSSSSNKSAKSYTLSPVISKTGKKNGSPARSPIQMVVGKYNITPKVPIKRVPIQPKTPSPTPINTSKNIVVIKNEYPVLSQGINSLNSNVVVLDSIPINTYPTTQIAPVKQVQVPPLMSNNGCNVSIDPKLLKRQQRKIKNRESACLSRKKKKDYLNSLEEKVKELKEANKRLTEENLLLKDRLSFYEDQSHLSKLSMKNAKPAMVLCAFLLVIGLNLEYLRSPFLTKSRDMDFPEKKFPQIPSSHHTRGLLWTDEQTQNGGSSNNTFFSPLTMCPASINQTESARLLLELERWIGKPELELPLPTVPVRRPTQRLKAKRKKVRLASPLIPVVEKRRYGPENESKNEIEVFSPKPDQLYSEFFEAINRQDDTFYVVSFNEQHLLVPALYHNKTRRPKMTLLMPSVLHNITSTQAFIPLMQIDCEVLDTKLVNVKYGAIPRQYRNVTRTSPPSGHQRPENGTRKKEGKASFKPYFLSKTLLKTESVH